MNERPLTGPTAGGPAATHPAVPPVITPPPQAAAAPRTGALSGALRRFLRREWVYVAMVVGALVGIAYTGSAAPSVDGVGPRVFWVWLILAPLYCLACVVDGWGPAKVSGAGRWRLVITQVLHWLAFLAAMWMLLRPEVRGMLNDDSVGLALLVLLAMGTFVAGVHAWSPGICVTGLVLGLAVPAIAWFQESAVLLVVVLALLALAALAVLALLHRMRRGGAGGVGLEV